MKASKPLVLIHEKLARGAARARLVGEADRHYSDSNREHGLFRQTLATAIEGVVEVPKTYGEHFWEVHREMTAEFVRIEHDRQEALGQLPPPQLST